MPHARSLRTIGQSLEAVHIEAFALDKKTNSYVVRSESLTPTRQWILTRNSIMETALDSLASEQKSTQLTGVMGGCLMIRSLFRCLRLKDAKKGGLTSHGRGKPSYPVSCVPWARSSILCKRITLTLFGRPIPFPLNTRHVTGSASAGTLVSKNCANSLYACGSEEPTATVKRSERKGYSGSAKHRLGPS